MSEPPAIPHLRRFRRASLTGRPAHAVASVVHAVDKVLAAVALVIVSPVFAGMALLARRRPSRSILRAQCRIGVNGTVFRLLGFRTVRRHPALDAMAQLINVLRGDMSLIGPRPPRPEELCRQLRVRPGIIRLR